MGVQMSLRLFNRKYGCCPFRCSFFALQFNCQEQQIQQIVYSETHFSDRPLAGAISEQS